MTGLDPDPATAHELLARELAGREYQESPLTRFWHWLLDRLDALSQTALAAGGFATLALVVVVVLALAVLAVALPRIRRERRLRAAPRGVLEQDGRTADQLRAAAEAARAAGQYPEAVAGAVRALGRRSVERRLLDDAPGRTTHETLGRIAQAFPAHAAELARVADLFDAVVYGGLPAGPADADAALALEGLLHTTRPVVLTLPR